MTKTTEFRYGTDFLRIDVVRELEDTIVITLDEMSKLEDKIEGFIFDNNLYNFDFSNQNWYLKAYDTITPIYDTWGDTEEKAHTYLNALYEMSDSLKDFILF